MSSNTIKVDLKLSVKKESEWSSSNPVLGLGRIAISSDKYNAFKIGDGTSTWTELSYNRAIASDVSSWAKQSTKPSYSKSEVGLSNVDNVKQIAGLASGATANHVVVFGSNGYTVKDSGFTIGKSVPSNAVFTDTVYTHPTSSGNKHIPSGGSSGQILRWSSDGVAVWGDENTVSYGTGNATTLGLTKLYTGTGTNTDGSMTQNAITTALNGKANGSHTHNYAGSSSAGGAANSVKTSLIIKLNGGDTEGTDLFTFNGSAAKTVNITASAIGAVTSGHTHTHANISDFDEAVEALLPTTLPNPQGLTISLNGTSQGAYTGSAAKSINITPSSIGAATSSHTHAATQVTGLTASRALVSNSSGQITASAVTSTELGYLDGVTSSIQTQLNGKAASSHTHNYAGSSSAGGVANIAAKLNRTAGSATKPVYFDENGIPVACAYTLGKSVPSNAVFTDTTYSTGTSSVAGITKLYTSTGTSTDGTMTRSAITTALNGKASSSHDHSNASASRDGFLSSAMYSQIVEIGDPLTRTEIEAICTY